MINIKKTNTILYCKNWHKVVSFYKNILELKINFENDWFVEFILNDLSMLSVANEGRSKIKSSNGAGVTISLNVDDIEKSYSFLIKKNLKLSEIKQVWNSEVFYIFDPEGNRIEFWS